MHQCSIMGFKQSVSFVDIWVLKSIRLISFIPCSIVPPFEGLENCLLLIESFDKLVEFAISIDISDDPRITNS